MAGAVVGEVQAGLEVAVGGRVRRGGRAGAGQVQSRSRRRRGRSRRSCCGGSPRSSRRCPRGCRSRRSGRARRRRPWTRSSSGPTTGLARDVRVAHRDDPRASGRWRLQCRRLRGRRGAGHHHAGEQAAERGNGATTSVSTNDVLRAHVRSFWPTWPWSGRCRSGYSRDDHGPIHHEGATVSEAPTTERVGLVARALGVIVGGWAVTLGLVTAAGLAVTSYGEDLPLIESEDAVNRDFVGARTPTWDGVTEVLSFVGDTSFVAPAALVIGLLLRWVAAPVAGEPVPRRRRGRALGGLPDHHDARRPAPSRRAEARRGAGDVELPVRPHRCRARDLRRAGGDRDHARADDSGSRSSQRRSCSRSPSWSRRPGSTAGCITPATWPVRCSRAGSSSCSPTSSCSAAAD